MYEVIDTKRGARKAYTEALIGRGDISMKEAEDARATARVNSSKYSTRSGNWKNTLPNPASRSSPHRCRRVE